MSGGWTALRHTPGSGVCKPASCCGDAYRRTVAAVDEAAQADLPVSPFILRYGNCVLCPFSDAANVCSRFGGSLAPLYRASLLYVRRSWRPKRHTGHFTCILMFRFQGTRRSEHRICGTSSLQKTETAQDLFFYQVQKRIILGNPRCFD